MILSWGALVSLPLFVSVFVGLLLFMDQSTTRFRQSLAPITANGDELY